MSSGVDEYRRKAAEAEKRAQECRDHLARETYEQIARVYREMAEQALRMGW
jgi:uncharacterized alpha-E superfamily protein